MSSWWLGIPPAHAAIECGGQEHRLRWELGELRALDHDDVDAERTLAALAGDRCACADVLDAWQRSTAEQRVLVLATRGPMEQLVIGSPWTIGAKGSAAASPAGMGGWSPYTPWGSGMPFVVDADGPMEPEQELIALLGLQGGLSDRLVASVAAAWAERLEGPDGAGGDLPPQFQAALYGRVTAALRRWLGRAALEVELQVVDATATPAVTAGGAGRVRVELPFGWLATVWAKGLATVMGRFCLAATTSDGSSWTLATVGPELGPIETMSLEIT